MAPREDRIIILTTGARWTRAVHGIYELFQKPKVQIPTRVGKKIIEDHSDGAEFIVGKELDEMIARHERVDVIYPIRGGKVKDWDALLAIWRHILLHQLYMRTSQNDCPLLVSLPPTLSRDDQAIATRLLFENFNVPSLIIAEEPILSAYAAGALTTTVVDFGWENCTISPIIENVGIIHTAVQRSDVGVRHVALYLAHLLSKDESIVQALIKLDAQRSARREGADQEDAGDVLAVRLFELAVELIQEGKVRAAGQGGEGEGAHARGRHREDEAEFDVAAALVAGREKAAIEEQERKNRAALEASKNSSEETGVAIPAEGENLLESSSNVVPDEAQIGATDEEGSETIVFQNLRIKVSPKPLLQACEVLWNPSLLLNMRGSLAKSPIKSMGSLDFGMHGIVNTNFDRMRSLPETLNASINSVVDVDRRSQLWETLLPTGAPAKLITNLNTGIIKASQAFLASNADNAPGTTALAGFGMINSGLNSEMASAGPNSRESPGMGGDIEGNSQPTTARCIKTPDYFAEFKDRTDLAPFLGATIFAKLAFTDPYGRSVTTKTVYNEKGPSASFLISAPS